MNNIKETKNLGFMAHFIKITREVGKFEENEGRWFENLLLFGGAFTSDINQNWKGVELKIGQKMSSWNNNLNFPRI